MSDSGDTEAEGSSTTNLAEGGKNDSKKKLIRLLTVMAYVSSVSGAAFMLSMYYLFLWEPKVAEHHLRADPNSHHQALALHGHGHGHQDHLRPPLGDPRDSRDHWQLGPTDPYSMGGYRPPGTAEAYPMGPYRSPASSAVPGGTPYWLHVPPGPPPPRPPSYSLVRDAGNSELLARVAALARTAREDPSATPPLAGETSAPVTLHRRRPAIPATPELPVSAPPNPEEEAVRLSPSTPSNPVEVNPPSPRSSSTSTPDDAGRGLLASFSPPSGPGLPEFTLSPAPSASAPALAEVKLSSTLLVMSTPGSVTLPPRTEVSAASARPPPALKSLPLRTSSPRPPPSRPPPTPTPRGSSVNDTSTSTPRAPLSEDVLVAARRLFVKA